MKKIDKLVLSIIIPAYNEEKKIESDISKGLEFLRKNKLAGEIIVSTDGITDRTNEIVEQLQRKYKNLKLLSERAKIGKGFAIKKGVCIARGEYIMFADAGLCVPYKFISDGIKKIKEGYDCALASRASEKSLIIKKQPIYRQLGSRVFGILVRTMIGVPADIKDTQCGFKIYRKKVAKRLFGQLQTKGFMFDIEIILRAKKEKYKVTSFPVEWENDEDTKFKPFSGSIQNFRDLFKMKFVYNL